MSVHSFCLLNKIKHGVCSVCGNGDRLNLCSQTIQHFSPSLPSHTCQDTLVTRCSFKKNTQEHLLGGRQSHCLRLLLPGWFCGCGEHTNGNFSAGHQSYFFVFSTFRQCFGSTLSPHNSQKMSLSKLNTNSKAINGINSTFHIFVSRLNLRTSATTFEGYEDSNRIFINNGLTGSSPVETLRLLYTVQKIVYQCNLASIDPAKYEGDLSNYCYTDTDGNQQPRIEQYIQVMRLPDDRVFGWFFHFTARDPTFNFNHALQNYWLLEEKKAKRMKTTRRTEKIPANTVRMCVGKTDYLLHTLNAYLNEAFSNEDLQCAELSGDFTKSNSPTQPYQCLTLAYSISLIRKYHPTAPAMYTDLAMYRQRVDDPPAGAAGAGAGGGDDDEDDDMLGHAEGNGQEEIVIQELPPLQPGTEKHITFPFGAHYVFQSARNPAVIMRMEMVTPLIIDTDDATSKRTARLLAAETQNVPDPDKSTIREAKFEASRNWFADAFRGKTPEQRNEIRHSSAAMENIISLLYMKENNPGGEEIMKWMTACIEKEPNWSVVKKVYGDMDKNLSPFANSAARDLFMQEHVGTVTAHREIAFLTLVSIMASDTQEFKLRLHVLFTGPPASSKSHIIDELKRMCIPGTVFESSSQSRKALTTTRCMNGLMNTMDELPDNFTSDGDGSGNPLEKTAMSSGLITNEQCFIDPATGERTSLITISERKMHYIACTNLAHIIAAMENRFYVCHVPKRTRKNVDEVTESHRRKTNQLNARIWDEVVELQRTRQFLYYVVWTMIMSGMIPRPSQELSLHLASATYSRLSTEMGIDIDPRDRQRVMMLCEALAIYDAVNQVFFSGTYFLPGEKFEFSHVLKCIPLLVARCEHFYFASTIMSDVLVDPTTPYVVNAIRALIESEPNPEKRYPLASVYSEAPPDATAAQDGQSDAASYVQPGTKKTDSKKKDTAAKRNYNYYFISLNAHAANPSVNVIKLISSMVAGQISMDSKTAQLADNIEDIVAGFVGKERTVSVYNDNNVIQPYKVKLPLARVKRIGSQMGYEILRDFVDGYANNPPDHVLETMRSTFTRSMIGKRFITGQTQRDGYGDKTGANCPFVYHVITVTEEMVVGPIKVEKEDYCAFGINTIIDQTDEAEEEDQYKFETIPDHVDLDEVYAKRWQDLMGCTPQPKYRNTKKCIGNYPDLLVEKYIKETADPPTGNTTTTTTGGTGTVVPPRHTGRRGKRARENQEEDSEPEIRVKSRPRVRI